MSNPGPSLLPEIFDSIVDHLHDEPEALRACCLASKSWVPRSRMYLFRGVNFETSDDLGAWKRTFPDPASSPAYHTRFLLVGCTEDIVVADVEDGGWIQSFRNVEELEVRGSISSLFAQKDPFAPFHNFSPALKSLRVLAGAIFPSQVLNLACSFPILKDLGILGEEVEIRDDDGAAFRPSGSPLFNGTLILRMYHGMEYITCRLLNLPNGLRFRKIVYASHPNEDAQWIAALVKGCSDTLEHLDLDCSLDENPKIVPIDLSKATKLRELVLRFKNLHDVWVTAALNMITSEHKDLKSISIHIPLPRRTTGMEMPTEWPGLDRTLVKLWESYGTHTKALYWARRDGGKVVGKFMGRLLPEMTKRGGIELVNRSEFANGATLTSQA